MQNNVLLSSNKSIISSKNQIYNIENQSAGNQPNKLVVGNQPNKLVVGNQPNKLAVGSSETIRALSKKDSE